ncbi:porin [Lentibacter algarum]|uniref:porin n=1 Tax=Lentibacter algarum TaxID=576131 RepID=UPI000B7E721D
MAGNRFLFATTALVATASVVAADVTFSGYGRFGVKHTGSVAAVAGTLDTYAAGVKTAVSGTVGASDITAAEDAVQASKAALAADTVAAAAKVEADALADRELELAARKGTAAVASDTLITSRLLLDINATTETDSGLTYGAFVRVRQDDGDTNAFNAARFYVKSGGLEVAVGNIWGAMDSMPGAYGQSIGLTGLGFAGLVTGSEMSFSSKGAGAAGSKEAVEAIYSMGDFSAHVSADGTDTEGFVSYTASGWTIALATSDSDVATSTETAATVSGKIGDVTVGAAWAEAVTTHHSGHSQRLCLLVRLQL